MALNGVNYNPYLYTGIKSVNNSYKNNAETNPFVSFANAEQKDTFETKQSKPNQSSETRKALETTKSQQGLIGKLWDGFKNLTGIGAGSNKVEKAEKDFENGKISREEMNEALMKYCSGQKQCVDTVADIASGIASFGAFALATGIGIAASPFTGGASLGLVAVGFGIAGAAGAGVKVGIKSIDCAVGGRKYDSFVYDLATGGINGIFAPVTAGIGGAAGKAVAGKVGVTALREGGEVVVKEALEGTAKGALTRTLLTTNVKYVGGTMGARALALGTDMAVNGAISGAVDSGTRYIAGDGENKSIDGFVKETVTGTACGLIMAPLIGGGMRLAGNGIGKLTGKLQSKVSANYSQAKSAMLNVPVSDNPDIEAVKGFGKVIEQTRGLIEDVQFGGAVLSEDFTVNLYDLSDNISEIFENAAQLSVEAETMSKENRALITEILKEISEGKDVSSKTAELTKRGIAINEILDTKISAFTTEAQEKLAAAAAANEALTQKTAAGIELAFQTADSASAIINEAAEQAKKIPDTNAYKQLGDLPDRAKNLYNTISSDAWQLNESAKTVREEIFAGNIPDGFEDFAKYYGEIDSFNAKLEQQISSVQSGAKRSGMDESVDILKERLSKLASSADFKNMTREEQIQALMENSNIMFSKFAQTFSSDDSLPPDVQTIFKQFTSNCTVSRNINQAQSLSDELYGAGKYTIKKSFGAGTIGETYLAQTSDGTEVVIKMLKEGVTPEKFAQDRAMFTKYINEFTIDAAEKEYKLNLINSMFDAWDKELDFGLEARGAKTMTYDAKRFGVAQTLEVGSKNGQNISLVMEKANGVKLDNLLEMIKLYKNNPAEYFEKYAKEIEANPALKTPEHWINDLGVAYQKAQNEQVMFAGESGIRTIHADPHPGNIFIDFDAATGKPKIVYIDAGNVVERTNSQTLQDIALSLNMMIGNSEGIAEAMLEGATLPEGANRAEITQKFAQLLDERLYKANVNLKNTQYTQSTINGIMKELNIIADSGNSNLMKATLQRIETSRAINGVCGTTANKIVDIKDLASGIIKSYKLNRKETVRAIKPIIQWAYKNNDAAMITFFQMIMNNAGIQSTAVKAP